jgi:hypothetical protein
MSVPRRWLKISWVLTLPLPMDVLSRVINLLSLPSPGLFIWHLVAGGQTWHVGSQFRSWVQNSSFSTNVRNAMTFDIHKSLGDRNFPGSCPDRWSSFGWNKILEHMTVLEWEKTSLMLQNCWVWIPTADEWTAHPSWRTIMFLHPKEEI